MCDACLLVGLILFSFQHAQSFNLKLNLAKCHLFLQQVKFRGRIFNSKGVSHDPSRIQSLTEMPIPKTAREIQQILMASQWMSRSILNFNQIVSPLQDIFETSMKSRPKRTKSVANRVKSNSFGWNAVHDNAFNALKAAIANSVQLAYPDENMIQCVFCDASYHACSGMVTQIPIEDLNIPFNQQKHQPLGLLDTDLMDQNSTGLQVIKKHLLLKIHYKNYRIYCICHIHLGYILIIVI